MTASDRTSKSRPVRIGLVQMQPDADRERSLDNAASAVREAARAGAEVVCLPELFTSPYFCQQEGDPAAFDTAETIPGFTTERLSRLAREERIVLVGGSIFEQSPSGSFFNTAPVFESDGTLLGVYRKTHIPQDPLYYEQNYFAPGDQGYRVFETSRGRIAVLICYDQWYPEAARAVTLAGAQIIFYPTAIGRIDERVEANITGDWQQMWENVQLGHAAANNVYVAAVNRVGIEGDLQFWGGSFLADPSSAILAKAGDAPSVVIAEADLSRVKAIQDSWRFLANRRPDTYAALGESVGSVTDQDN